MPPKSKLYKNVGKTPCDLFQRARYYDRRTKTPTCLSVKALKSIRGLDPSNVPTSNRKAMATAIHRKYAARSDKELLYDRESQLESAASQASIRVRPFRKLMKQAKLELKPPLETTNRRNQWLSNFDLDGIAQRVNADTRRRAFVKVVDWSHADAPWLTPTELQSLLVDQRKRKLFFIHRKQGNHWILVYIRLTKAKSINEYLDPYGSDLDRTISKGFKKTIININHVRPNSIAVVPTETRIWDMPLQRDSSSCGFWTIWFLLNRMDNISWSAMEAHHPTDAQCQDLRTELFIPNVA